ncbi:MAG: RNA polymerase sigma-70 factor [Saprospiraceae bacterium]|nr:RNA polymerase sigma-70 factor [Saprospiraceae bacterium]
MCHFAAKIVGDTNVAEDIVQEVFIHFWHKGIIPDQSKSIKSLFFTSTKNKALEYLRKEAINNKMLDYLKTQTDEIEPSVSEEEIDKYMLIDQIYVCIRQLPPKCADIFTLSKVNGLSYAQIAEKQKISSKTVENHMTKAFKMLRAMLAQKNTRH